MSSPCTTLPATTSTSRRPARTLAVADIFEALTADRSYRDAMPHDRALEIVREQRGTGLCPAAVDALEAAVSGPSWTADLAGFAPRAKPAREPGPLGPVFP